MQNETQKPVEKTNPLLIVLFWAYVTLPLAWGVYMTLLDASKLFTD